MDAWGISHRERKGEEVEGGKEVAGQGVKTGPPPAHFKERQACQKLQTYTPNA